MELGNPPGVSPQRLTGTCSSMCPDAYLPEITSALEIVNGEPTYAIKIFKRTLNESVGNTGPEFLRTKQALHQSMRTLRAWLIGLRCAPACLCCPPYQSALLRNGAP